MTGSGFWRIAAELPGAADPDAAAEALGVLADAVSVLRDGAAWRVSGYAEAEPDLAAVRAALAAAGGRGISVAREAAKDWVAEQRRGLPALDIGRFRVLGSHVAEAAPAGSTPVLIDAGLAFGTGRHESTEGCLRAIERLYPGDAGPGRALDLGTGSGILAIALARAYGTRATAADADPVAVAVARRNAALNGVAGFVSAVAGGGLDAGPYDLVVANIVADPLIALAPAVAGALGRRGVVVLSGLLAGQADAVAAAYAALGLGVAGRLVLGEWATLIMDRETEAPARRPE